MTEIPEHLLKRAQAARDKAAAEDFTRSVTRRTGPRPAAPSVTRRRDLAIASIDDLVSVLGAATRLGYDDGRAGTSARTGNAIAYALALATWTGLQQMQLRQAYMTGREHGVSERLRGDARSVPASARRTRRVRPTSTAPDAG